MFIVNYNREVVVNMDNISAICVENKYIQAVTAHDMRITLGAYASESRGKEVFKEMMKAVFMPMMLFLKDCVMDNNDIVHFKEMDVEILQVQDNSGKISAQMIDRGIYYMTEE